jgi:chromate transporter
LLVWEYFLIGITGFGGGLQGRFYHLAVSKHEWISDEEFADVNASASLAPGGNASNVGLEIGRRLRGLPGMILAQVCLVLPGTVIMLLAGELYVAYQGNVVLQGALQGLQSAAIALILYSATKLGISRWRWPDFVVAAAACLAMEALKAPLWVVLPAGALISLWVFRRTGR